MPNVKCSHCNLSFKEEYMIIEEKEDKKLYFCCNGCQGVYHLLNSEGLGSFYNKKGETTLNPANSEYEDLAKFDTENFKNHYIKEDSDGFYYISLIIENIHCTACVWLNEKVLHKQDGIIEANINYTNNKAKIVWNNDEIKLSQIIETIRAIGYNAYPYDASLQEERADKTKKEYYTRILVAVFGAMNIMWLAVAHYAGYFGGIEQQFKDVLNIAEFVLATPVLFYSGWIFFRGAYFGYKNRVVNMDTLVSWGALSAYIYSIYAMITQNGEVYFDSVVMIITFILIGKYLEVISKKRAVDTIDTLMGTVPTEVTILNNNKKELIAVESIKVGDIIELKAGEKVVIDGEVTNFEASFDESSLTGEATPILKTKGSKILSGTICLDAKIEYKATKDISHSMLTSISNLLEDAMTKKPKLEQLANSVSGYFSTTILVIAILTFLGWYFFNGDFEEALIISISVIVIACPCALGLATPMATLVGMSVAMKKNILFKEASFLETMAKSSVVAFDKTGTITKGEPRVIKETTLKEFNRDLLYSLVSSSNHPISKGVKEYLKESKELKLKEHKTVQAKGVEATFDESHLLGGNSSLLKDFNIKTDITSDNTLFFFAIDREIVAYFELQDTIRENAKESIKTIQDLGIETIMLTGDHNKSALKIANEVNIKEVHSSLLPQDKAKIIQNLQKENKIVVMVGDGINDTIALASSDISIAMGSGADVAISVSDIVLLDEEIEKVSYAYKISKRTFQAVKENLGFSLLYNLIAVPLAVMGFVNPLVAALSMSLSSLVVVGNSLRIKK